MRGAALVLMLAGAVPARAARLLVVISEPPSASTREALDGFRSVSTETIEIVSAERKLPPGPYGVIVAFGARAAARARSGHAPTIIALAPSIREGRAAEVVVALTPPPERFIDILAAAGVHRLLAVRAAPADADFNLRARAAGKLAGVEIENALLPSPDALPDLLRRVGPGSDAIWLAPDPATVTAETFAVMRELARGRGIPFFAPSVGLVSDGIRGDFSVSFRECGREARRAALELLAGRPLPKIIYPVPAVSQSVLVSRPSTSTQ